MIMLLPIVLSLFIMYKAKIEDNTDYMGRKQTTAINGVFALVVFLSHSKSYIQVSGVSGKVFDAIFMLIGQMMVVMFLFNSGYGLAEQYKRKEENYINGFLKRRVLKTWLHFIVALSLYAMLSKCLCIRHSKLEWLLCWTGWLSIGNSNWYIFDIIMLYLAFYFGMQAANKTKYLIYERKTVLISVWLITLMLWGILYYLKGSEQYWYNTLLAFPFGVTLSFRKDILDTIYADGHKWKTALFVSLILFSCFYLIRNSVGINISAILFAFVCVLISMRIRVGNKGIIWVGNHLFYIYILQRIPMIILDYYGLSDWPILFILTSFIFTLLLTQMVASAINKFDKFIAIA